MHEHLYSLDDGTLESDDDDDDDDDGYSLHAYLPIPVTILPSTLPGIMTSP